MCPWLPARRILTTLNKASSSNPYAGYEHLPPGASAASAENSQMRVNTTMNNLYPVTEALPIHAPDQKIKRWVALTVLMLPVLLVSVDNTVLAFAVPSIAQALEPSSSEQLWIVDAYSLVLAGLLVPMGSLGDRIGRRKILLIGSVGFAVISALAAFAPTALLLVIARAVLGFFGAMLMPATLSLIRNIFRDPKERRTAIAVWAAGFSAGAALGPIVGGLLLSHFWWGSVFLMAVPVLVPFLALAPMTVPESKDPNPGPLDMVSILLIMIAMIGITFGLTHISEAGVDALALSTALIGAVFGFFFVRRQLRRGRAGTTPMLDVRLFKNTVFTGGILANLFAMFVDVGFLLFVSQHLQLVSGYSPMQAGLFLIPGLACTIVAGLYAAKLVSRFHPAVIVSSGLALGALGYLFVVFFGSRNDLLLMLSFMFLGLSVGAAQTISNDLILSSVPANKAGAASAISETAYEFGTVLGTVVIGGMLTAIYRAQVMVPAGLNADAAHAAGETLGGATAVAGQLPSDLSAELLHSAHAAFDSGVLVTATFSAVLLAVLSVFTYRMLRSAPAELEKAEH